MQDRGPVSGVSAEVPVLAGGGWTEIGPRQGLTFGGRRAALQQRSSRSEGLRTARRRRSAQSESLRTASIAAGFSPEVIRALFRGGARSSIQEDGHRPRSAYGDEA